MRLYRTIKKQTYIQLAGILSLAFLLLSTAGAPVAPTLHVQIVQEAALFTRQPDLAALKARSHARALDQHRVQAFIQSRNRGLRSADRRQLVATILEQAPRLRFPAHARIDGRSIDRVALLTAFISVESTFKRRAVSRSNARGYMQLKPTTVAWLDRKQGRRSTAGRLFETRINLMRGVDYINHLYSLKRDIRFTCLAYNAGPGSVQRGHWHESYWRHILRDYRKLVRLKTQLKKTGPGSLASR